MSFKPASAQQITEALGDITQVCCALDLLPPIFSFPVTQRYASSHYEQSWRKFPSSTCSWSWGLVRKSSRIRSNIEIFPRKSSQSCSQRNVSNQRSLIPLISYYLHFTAVTLSIFNRWEVLTIQGIRNDRFSSMSTSLV